MPIRNAVKFAVAPFALLALLAAIICETEGVGGLRFFANFEALAVVVLGTALALSVSYPAGRIRGALSAALTSTQPSLRHAEVLESAAGYAVAMGWVGTLVGLVMLLTSVEEMWLLPRRVGLALDALLFGVVLAKLFLAPAARRLTPRPD